MNGTDGGGSIVIPATQIVGNVRANVVDVFLHQRDMMRVSDLLMGSKAHAAVTV